MGSIQARDSGDIQAVQALRADITYSTSGVSSGLLFGRLPKNSFVIGVSVEVTTAFNAATTNVVTVGTSTTATEIIDASTSGSSVTEGTAGSYMLMPIASFACSRTATTPLYVKYTQTGTAATAGAATIVVLYVTGLPENVPSSSST